MQRQRLGATLSRPDLLWRSCVATAIQNLLASHSGSSSLSTSLPYSMFPSNSMTLNRIQPGIERFSGQSHQSGMDLGLKRWPPRLTITGGPIRKANLALISRAVNLVNIDDPRSRWRGLRSERAGSPGHGNAADLHASA